MGLRRRRKKKNSFKASSVLSCVCVKHGFSAKFFYFGLRGEERGVKKESNNEQSDELEIRVHFGSADE